MNVLSLFAGIGGLELGLERAGMTVVGQVEIDPYCQRVLAKHWPEVPRHDDVRTCVEWWVAGPMADADELDESQIQASNDPVGGQRPEVGRWSVESARTGAGGRDIAGDFAEGVRVVGGAVSGVGPLLVPGRPTVDLVCGGFPCQPVSVAGQRLAQADPRWLWPAFHTVVRGLRPRYVLVENVPGLLAAGMGDVLGDLAGLGYDAEWDRIPAAFVGAPHLRGRIFIVAYPQRGGVRLEPVTQPGGGGAAVAGADGAIGHVADTSRASTTRHREHRRPSEEATTGLRLGTAERSSGQPEPDATADVADTDSQRLERSELFRQRHSIQQRPSDGGWWATEPDVGRVAHGVPARLDRLRALGNAVVPQVAEHVGRLILAADRERAA